MIAGSISISLKCIGDKLCLRAALLHFLFQPDRGRKEAKKAVAFDFSHRGHALVMLYVQFLCSGWSEFDR